MGVLCSVHSCRGDLEGALEDLAAAPTPLAPIGTGDTPVPPGRTLK